MNIPFPSGIDNEVDARWVWNSSTDMKDTPCVYATKHRFPQFSLLSFLCFIRTTVGNIIMSWQRRLSIFINTRSLSLLYYMPSAQIWNVHSALLVQLLTDVKAQFFPVHTGVQRIHLKWVRIFIGLSFQGIFRVQWLDCYSTVDNYKYTLLFGECRNDSLE